MEDRKYLTAEEVAERYRGAVSVGTLRNWRAMRVGPAFLKRFAHSRNSDLPAVRISTDDAYIVGV
jgi:hypothetical protein